MKPKKNETLIAKECPDEPQTGEIAWKRGLLQTS